MEDKNKNKALIEFGNLLAQLTPVQVGAVAKILKVKLTTDELEERDDGKQVYKARPGIEVANDVFEAYSKLNRTQKRNLLKLIKKATPSKGKD